MEASSAEHTGGGVSVRSCVRICPAHGFFVAVDEGFESRDCRGDQSVSEFDLLPDLGGYYGKAWVFRSTVAGNAIGMNGAENDNTGEWSAGLVKSRRCPDEIGAPYPEEESKDD